jgi:hypothetical protein
MVSTVSTGPSTSNSLSSCSRLKTTTRTISRCSSRLSLTLISFNVMDRIQEPNEKTSGSNAKTPESKTILTNRTSQTVVSANSHNSRPSSVSSKATRSASPNSHKKCFKTNTASPPSNSTCPTTRKSTSL